MYLSKNYLRHIYLKSRFRSRSQDFCQFLEDFGFGFRKFGLRKKSRFRCRTIWCGKKVLVSVSLKLVSEKSVRFGFVKFGLGLVKILFCHSVGGDADNDDDQEEDNGHTGSRQALCCSQSG